MSKATATTTAFVKCKNNNNTNIGATYKAAALVMLAGWQRASERVRTSVSKYERDA